VFSILPRFLFPSKPQGASTELFSRYTGVTLTPGTTMGLGLIGEMYANFGGAGGIAGTFVYGVLIGWLFAAFAERALLNPMWWAIAAFVLVPSVEPGLNIEDLTNHVVKAAVLLVAVMYFVPSLSRALAPLQPADVPLGLPEPQAG
jgi:hypothetical protein